MTTITRATEALVTQDTELEFNSNNFMDNVTVDDLIKGNPITLTDIAAEYIKTHVEKFKDKGMIAMRLAVTKGGCSGKQYSFDLTNKIDENTDLVFAKNGAAVVVTKNDFESFAGLEIDFETEGLNKYVVFRNPNAKNSCGCGKSFS